MPNKDQLKNKHTKLQNLSLSGFAFLITFLVMIILYKLKGYAPFGDNSLACMDANNTYVDFLCGLKDIISHKSGLVYSFSKGLGGNLYGLINTDFFSPVNLLIVFFKKNEIQSFFDIAVAIKLALSAATMAWFLNHRTPDLNKYIASALAIGYGMCQYNIAQSSNIFFLEGVYMLPLFMLGVYYIVENGRPFTLMFSVAYLVTFSWYVGAINCFFTVVWAVFEFLWFSAKEKVDIKKFLYTLKQLTIAGFGGVLISGIAFFPTVVALRKSSEGGFYWGVFHDSNVFYGNVVTTISNYYMGSLSYEHKISLFCGSLAMIGCLAFFFSSRFSFVQKCIAALTTGFVAISFFWKPIVLVYSMLKYPISFWCRYSHLGIFVIIFFAALFFEGCSKDENYKGAIAKAAFLYILIALIFNNDMEAGDLKWVYAEIFCVIVVTLMLCAQSAEGRKKLTVCCSVMMIGFISFEMGCNAILIMSKYHLPDIQEAFIDYVDQGESQIDSIRQLDDGYYRISQTKTRNMQEGNLTANYDDAHMLNYWGVASYTSVPDDLQREFLDRSGYHLNGEDMYIVNTSILPVDSLLGVKYIMSDREISGLEKVESIETKNDKDVYYNPYSLPMLFTMKENGYNGYLNFPTITPTGGWPSNINPFLYQNDLFSQLSGKECEVFVPLKYKKQSESESRTDYVLEVPDGSYALYGNLPWSEPVNEKISIDGEFLTDYAQWLSPSVFYIPAKGDEVVVSVSAEDKLSVAEEQFYAVDIKKLREITEPLKEKSVNDCIIKDGYVEANVESEQDDLLFTTIQYDPHWEVKINGETATPNLFGDTFMTLPLEKGSNHIVMKYRLGGLRGGMLATAFGLLLAAAEFVRLRRGKRKTEEARY